MAFVKQLFKVFADSKAQQNHGFLRNKNLVDPEKSDVELFQSMPLNDTWDDASAASVYFYLRAGQHLVIPPCWAAVIDEFDRELDARVS